MQADPAVWGRAGRGKHKPKTPARWAGRRGGRLGSQGGQQHDNWWAAGEQGRQAGPPPRGQRQAWDSHQHVLISFTLAERRSAFLPVYLAEGEGMKKDSPGQKTASP